MLWGLTILPVTAAAGLIAGGGMGTFTAAALAAASVQWLQRIRAANVPTLYANLDPVKPETSMLLDALREALDAVSRTQHPIRLRLTAFAEGSKTVFSLDLNREGEPELTCGTRKTALKRAGIWLPDHPLPLILPRARSLTLRFDPCGPTRTRVSPDFNSAIRSGHWLGLSLLATAACAADIGWLLAAVLGFAFQAYLREQQAQRAPSDSRVKRG